MNNTNRRGQTGLGRLFGLNMFRPHAVSRSASSDLQRAAAVAIESLESRVLLSSSGTGVTPSDLQGNPPQAAVSLSSPAITTAGQSVETVTVTYTSNASINLSTIGAGNIVVTEEGVASPTPLAVSLQQVNPNVGSPTSVTATYNVAAPSGTFGPADNGTYDVSLQANQVEDGSQMFVAASTNTFTVNVADQAPAASISAPADVTGASVASFNVVVNYTDALAVTASSIVPGNIQITGPGGASLTPSSVSVNPSSGDAATLTATYVVNAPRRKLQPGRQRRLYDRT